MKKTFFISCVFVLISCSDSTGNNESNVNMKDTMAPENSASTMVDTVSHPSGVANSSVISTDTAAINVQNTLKKADSVARSKGN